MTNRLLTVLFLAAGFAAAQTAPVPNCQYRYRYTNRTGETVDGVSVLTPATAAPWINNFQPVCNAWQLTYSSEGFSAVSVNLQSAPRTFAGTVGGSTPGTAATFSGTDVLSTLPLTSTTGGSYIGYGYYPYIRINNVTATGTGSIEVLLSGWTSITYAKGISGSGGSSGGGGTGGGGSQFSANQPISGCGVEWTGLLHFTVGACVYTIEGVQYTSAITNLTLTAADMTNPRIDGIIVDSTGVASVLSGTADSNPLNPTVDPATQLGLTFIYVAAGATVPSNITSTSIYEENTEWTTAVSAGTFNAASTSNPFRGTKDVEATNAALGDYVSFTKPASGTEVLSNYTYLIFYIRTKATWPTGNGGGPNAARFLNIVWQNATANQLGVILSIRDGQFGFSSSNTTVYQQIAVPISLFGVGVTPAATVRFQIGGGQTGSTIGFYLDSISLSNIPLNVNPALPVPQLFRFSCTKGDPTSSTVLSTGDLNCYAPNGPSAGSIQGWETYGVAAASATCSFTADIWKKNAGVPAAAQKISASAPVTLTTANSSNGAVTNVASWSRGVSPHDDWNATLATVTGCVFINFSVFYQ